MLRLVTILAFAALALACPASAFAKACADQLTRKAIQECLERERAWEREHPKPSPSEIAAQYRVTPLPQAAVAAAKPGVFKGFYIGMTREAALAAAASALAPWPAVVQEQGNGIPGQRDLNVFLVQGPGNVPSLQSCIARNENLSRELSRQDDCVDREQGEHFVIAVETKTNLVTNIAISDDFMRAALGYNLDEAGLDAEDFAKLMGKRLGVSFEKVVVPGQKCPYKIFTLDGSYCAPHTPATYRMKAIDLKQCKCEIQIFPSLAMNLIGSGSYEVNRNEGAVKF